MVNELTEKYISVIHEYFQLLTSSDTIKGLPNRNTIIQTGLITILHIFRLNVIQSKNVENAHFLCQKANYFYLEYIEQIHEKNMTQDLNTTDAVMFIYNKTLNVENPIDKKRSNSLIYEDLFLIDKITHYLCYWDNHEFDVENRITILSTFLEKFLLIREKLKPVISFLHIIREKMQYNMKIEEYSLYLEEIYKILKKKKRIYVYDDMVKHFMECIYTHDESNIIYQYKERNISLKKFVECVFP